MRALYKLTARKVANEKDPGRHSDGGGLYLQIGNGGRSWIFRYRDRRTGRHREMGLGPVHDVTLADARQKAARARSMLSAGEDPLADRRARKAVVTNAKAFGEFVTEFLGDDDTPGLLESFKNAKHRYQWRQTLTTYAKPLWPLRLQDIKTADIEAVLRPIWTTKAETARRLRARLERVLDAAKAKRLRDGDNPAAWKGNLKSILGGKAKRKASHYPAIPVKEMPEFMRRLRKLNSTSALALEFTILTAARSGETRFMRWEEYDAVDKVWTVPASRMKAEKEHRVPLPSRAVEILNQIAKPSARAGLVFKGAKKGEPLSDAALLMCLRGIREGFTTHGMRSSFRDWVGDLTEYPDSLAEFALAHQISDEVEAAYRRGDALERRRKMMQDWQEYLA